MHRTELCGSGPLRCAGVWDRAGASGVGGVPTRLGVGCALEDVGVAMACWGRREKRRGRPLLHSGRLVRWARSRLQRALVRNLGQLLEESPGCGAGKKPTGC